jgi:hypothetical protein
VLPPLARRYPGRGSPSSPVSPAHLLDALPAGVIAPRRPSLSNPHSPRGGPRFSSIRFQRDRILPCRSLRPRRAISQKPQD